MKKLFIPFLAFLFYFFPLTAVYPGEGQLHQGELIITVVNAPNGIVFEFHAIGTRWDENLDITTEHAYYADGVTGDEDEFIGRYDLITAVNDDSNPVIMPLGLIKVLVSESNPERYFYIDWRTSTLVTESHGSPDLYVTYNNQTGYFLKDGTTYINGSTQKVWEFSYYPLETEGFEPFVPDNFAVSSSGSPQLSWNHSSSEDYITGYKVYRAIVNQAGNFSETKKFIILK